MDWAGLCPNCGSERSTLLTAEGRPQAIGKEAMRQIVEHNVDRAPVFFTFRDEFIQESFDLERVRSVFRARPKTGS